MAFKVVIPARYNSTRLPGKPLIEIGGIPMVIHVARKAKMSGADEVVIATDDKKIIDVVSNYDFEALLTRDSHVSGTDRVLEVVDSKKWSDNELIVNVQGDEPLIDPNLIKLLYEGMIKEELNYATAASKFKNYDDYANPNNVKVILGKDNFAIYFSRSKIPYFMNNESDFWDPNIAFHHIGLYGYTPKLLRSFCNFPESKHEATEKLEQLRAIDNNLKIKVFEYHGNHIKGVDTLDDLATINKFMANQI
ncbi:MAG: 3-deoxy-manno-octulosonate cytidylyltransferase [Methylophilaceae bacterium]|jgi:3-deoxy-manno-octulosonate cytidylyltransferase (CMP-KDO synthetase)|nr:3-deoxy-manno-octulosonate cytidylyltransferase [Methylophilaceae bacterium]